MWKGGRNQKEKSHGGVLNLTGPAPNFLTMNPLGSFLGTPQERVCS